MEGFLNLAGVDSSFGGYLVYAGTFLGILIFFSGVMQLISRGENHSEAKSRRMKMIAAGSKTPEILALLKPAEKNRAFLGLPVLSDLPRDLMQAGMVISPRRFLLLCLAATIVIAVIGTSLLKMTHVLLIAALMGFCIPLAVVKRRRSQRLEKLISQLPDALDLMSRGLSVGHPLNTSIGAVAEEMADPIGTEFGLVFDQVSFGDDLTDAVQDFADRIDLEDVHYLAASVGIQHGTGGDLARVTRLLAGTVRNRIAMRRRIRAISSEGRMTAQFLSLLPVGIFLMTSVTEPNYYGGIMDDPLFPYFAGAVVGFTVINYLVLRHLVNFRI